jgi:hypothetical protein
MSRDDQLVALNEEIGKRETAGDAPWFERLLAPQFAMRRASTVHLDRATFLAGVGPSAVRHTTGIEVLLRTDRAAVVTCVVRMQQTDGTSKDFRNARLFSRPDPSAAWQLLGWANEPG